jgi:hypothetical protein
MANRRQGNPSVREATGAGDGEDQTMPAVTEQRARRAALKVGLLARKSRWRKDSADNFGEFMIVDPTNNSVVAGARFEMTAADVVDWVQSPAGALLGVAAPIPLRATLRKSLS